MGLVQIFKDSFKTSLEESRHAENAELGYWLFLSARFDQPNNKYSNKIKQIKKELNNKRIPILIRAAELVGEPTTLKQLYTVSHAYLEAGASVRDKAIFYMEKYIEAGACWEGTLKGIQNDFGLERDLQKTAIASEHISLGKLYEAEYRFDDAMKQYKSANELCPYDADGIVCMSQIFCKTGDYEGGIKMFKDVLKSKYYRVYIYRGKENCAFIAEIDKAYNELLDKQQTGYVYKPRKKASSVDT